MKELVEGGYRGPVARSNPLGEVAREAPPLQPFSQCARCESRCGARSSYEKGLRRAGSHRRRVEEKLGKKISEAVKPDGLEGLAQNPLGLFIVERVLGFGLSGNSNVAQRFSNAMTLIFNTRFDAVEEAEFALLTDKAELAWVEARRKLSKDTGFQQCR